MDKYKKKLDAAYRGIIEPKEDKSIIEKNVIFENPIYFDGRQYSFKIPKRVFDFVEYKKGDKIRFIINEIDSKKIKLSIQYIKSRDENEETHL